MPTPIEQALISLVPTLNGLPQDLLDLSASLLAQSRAKAATLKQDEEIGRTYACCHLAVERLKNKLDVDKIVAKPPVPPRVYKKLYGFLDAALTPATPRTTRFKDAGVAGAGTPGSRRRTPAKVVGSAVGTPSKSAGVTASKSAGKSAVTPSKTPASAKSAGSAVSARRTRSAGKVEEAPEQEHVAEHEQPVKGDALPEQAKPMITAICTALEAPAALPHVVDAMSAILEIRGWNENVSKKRKATATSSATKRRRTSSGVTPSSTTPQPLSTEPESITPETLPALLIALSLITTFSLRNTLIDGTAYSAARTAAIATLETPPEETEVDAWLHKIKQEGWLALPWFAAVKSAASAPVVPNTPKKNKEPAKTPLRRQEKHAPRPRTKDLGDVEMMDVVTEEREQDLDEIEEKAGAGLRWGLGTMFQDAVDWLSLERRREYKTWERQVRERIDEIETA